MADESVWVVLNGEKHEGGSVVAVCATEESAIEKARSVETCFPGGWRPSGHNAWENGCDYVLVEEWQVSP